MHREWLDELWTRVSFGLLQRLVSTCLMSARAVFTVTVFLFCAPGASAGYTWVYCEPDHFFYCPKTPQMEPLEWLCYLRSVSIVNREFGEQPVPKLRLVRLENLPLYGHGFLSINHIVRASYCEYHVGPRTSQFSSSTAMNDR